MMDDEYSNFLKRRVDYCGPMFIFGINSEPLSR